MKIFLLIISTIVLLFSADYLTNKSCQECHPDIYDEYQTSYHAKTYFNDELHRKVAQKVSVYDCGHCHMPAAKNLLDMDSGKTMPNPIYKEQKDAISCFYCHQIAYVKKAHKHNINILSKQAGDYKPTLYGSLNNPDDSDKHSSVKSPIYDKYVCMGCHSHKRNSNNVLIFKAINGNMDSKECIKCHMPYIDGPVEKMNKRARMRHRSHYFAGIHNSEMRSKSVKLSVEAKDNKIIVTIENLMSHPLIIHPSRIKYLKIKLIRNRKIVWKNFQNDPMEDKKGTFVTDFLDEHGRNVTIPAFAKKRGFINNIGPKDKKELIYIVPELQKNDKIVVEMDLMLVKPECAKLLELEDKSLTEPIVMKRVEMIIK